MVAMEMVEIGSKIPMKTSDLREKKLPENT